MIKLEEIKAKAEKGDAAAQCQLARHYLETVDCDNKARNDAEAVKWLRSAAEKGLADAQFELGLCYTIAVNRQLDPVEAAKWFRKAAEQGHSKAQYFLGFNYF